MADFSNVLSTDAATANVSPSNVLSTDAATLSEQVTGTGSFSAALSAAAAGGGTVVPGSVPSNVLTVDASTTPGGAASNVLVTDAATVGPGDDPDIENLGSGLDFPVSLSVSFSGSGIVTAPPSITGTASWTVSLTGAGEAGGTLIQPGWGSAAFSGVLSGVMTGEGSAVPPQAVVSVIGSGAFTASLSAEFSLDAFADEAFITGRVIDAPLNGSPLVEWARLNGRPMVLDAEFAVVTNIIER